MRLCCPFGISLSSQRFGGKPYVGLRSYSNSPELKVDVAPKEEHNFLLAEVGHYAYGIRL